MGKKFKDLKKGDHLYWVGCNYKTHEPILCEYELVTDMELIEIYENKVLNIGEKLPIYRCFMIPLNYDPNNHYYVYDGINPIEYRPGWAWDYDGDDTQMCTSIENAKSYYLKYYCDNAIHNLDKDIKKLEKKIRKLKDMKLYHNLQKHNFKFDRKII